MMKKVILLLWVVFVLHLQYVHAQVSSYAFSASAGVYTPVSGGISPVLTGNGNDPLPDEGVTGSILIGFSFKYLGTDYTSIYASTNGFVSFAPLVTSFFSNDLFAGGNGRLILAPLWEDLSVSGNSNIQYITSGTPGNRIFTMQWSNVLYDFGANTASLSFQLKLYETSNIIEFVYGQLAGAVQDFSGGASIGITGSHTGEGSFLSLSNCGMNPQVSSSVSTDTIKTKPESGQVYRFTPPACMAPGNLTATGITSTGANVGWTDGSATSFEYAVTTSLLPPPSGVVTGLTSAYVSGLLPGTQYYLHVRKDCSGNMSSWSRSAFATTCDAAEVPYTAPLSFVNVPALPLCLTASDDNGDGHTWKTYSSAGTGWSGPVIAYVYNSNGTTPANDWLFTGGLNLTGGTSYRLKFKYNNDATSQYTEKLRVAYGTTTSAGMMTNILADYSSVSAQIPRVAAIDFVPSSSGVFYIGFQAWSDADKNVLILGDISVSVTPSCDIPRSLSAEVQASGTSAIVRWQTPVTGTASGYEYAVTASPVPPASGTSTTLLNATVSNLSALTPYYLHIRTNCNSSFSEWATTTFATVGNDVSCQAALLTAGAAAVCSNTLLATSANDPESECSTPNHTVWYKYIPSVNGTVTLQLTTPASPANSLHGWATWYEEINGCPNLSLTKKGSCHEFGQTGNNDTDYLISPVLSAGEIYYIMIDGASGDTGEFCISIPACSPPVNIVAGNITSTSASASWQGTGNFILEYGPAGFTPGTGNIAGTGGTVISTAVSPLSLTGLSPSAGYHVYVRQDCTAAANGYSNNSPAAAFTTLGTPPLNDDCSSATVLTVFDNSCGGITAGTTLNATASAVMPLPVCGMNNAGYDDDIWYRFTPAAGQQFVNINFTYISDNDDPVAQIYTSSDNTSTGVFSLYACSDDEGGGYLPGFYSLPVTPGTTYFIRAFTVSQNVHSGFGICITKGLLINDNATGAINLVAGQGCTPVLFTNAGATQSPGEPSGSCSSTAGYATVWYKFVAPAGGAVRISTAGGTGNTLTNTRVALFAAGDVTDYSTFTILSCDEDGGAGLYENMSVLYAAGLSVNGTYYIQVDKFDAQTSEGTFCIMVDSLAPAMIATDNNCSGTYQVPAGTVAGYTGWVPLMDANSKLIALVRNNSGGAVNAYDVRQNVHTGTLRQDPVSGEYYLNRNYSITNTTTGSTTLQVQLFYLNTELAALQTMDPAAAVNRMRVTRQSGTVCQPDFVAANGINTELSMMGNGSQNGVNWIQVNTNSLSNFYIHSTRSRVNVKAFLQGAFNADLRRHKNVTVSWAGILNTYALAQPYNTTAFGNYTGSESVPPGFFVSTTDTTDITDWVLLEIKNNSGTLISRRAALIREDGQVVDTDGVSPVNLYGVSGNYHVTVRHRNHLGISTQSTQLFVAIGLGASNSSPIMFDFSAAQNSAIFGDNLAYAILEGINVLIGGNSNGNNSVRYTGLNNDLLTLLAFLNGDQSGVLSMVYNGADINLDGSVKYTGLNNDALFLLAVLGANESTVVTEQKR
ncbi:MAG: choice-of-anchor J domain-containing protein [Chitinophagaceae bacterium]|nr:choice-of-anchor J domain-containing protein [Chitinophagaceae bacterium]